MTAPGGVITGGSARDLAPLDGAPAPRILDAALACIARVGWSKTTVDDVAREAGVSRATLYRYFAGKQPLLSALLAREAARFRAGLERATDDAATLEDALTALVVAAARAVRTHDALQFALAVEPDLLLTHLAFDRGSGFLRECARLLAPVLARFVPPERAERAGETVARVVLSYLCSPSPSVPLADAGAVRDLVRDYVAPAVAPPVPAELEGNPR